MTTQHHYLYGPKNHKVNHFLLQQEYLFKRASIFNFMVKHNHLPSLYHPPMVRGEQRLDLSSSNGFTLELVEKHCIISDFNTHGCSCPNFLYLCHL